MYILTSVSNATSGICDPHASAGTSGTVGTSKWSLKPDMSRWSSKTSKKDHLPKASKKNR